MPTLKDALSVISVIIVERPENAFLKLMIMRVPVFFCRAIFNAFSLAIVPQVASQQYFKFEFLLASIKSLSLNSRYSWLGCKLPC